MSWDCDFCGQNHGNFRGPDKSNAMLIDAIKKAGLIHAFIGTDISKPCHCGAPVGLWILPVVGPAHPATPVIGHKGQGCIGPWLHNKALMESEDLAPLPLPCDDPYCNELWKKEAT